MYRILICDDQPDIVNALKIYLAPEGYQLFTACNGLEALETVRKEDIHLVLLDIKHIEPEHHRKLTGHTNEKILAFAEYLSQKQVPIWVRHVMVPTITDDEKYLYDLGWFLGGLTNLKALDVLPYHTMGEVKYQKLGVEYKLKGIPAMDKDKVIEKKQVILNGIRKRREELGI